MPKIPINVTRLTLSTPEGKKTIRVQFIAKGGIGAVFLDLSTKPPEPSRLFKIVEPGSQESYRQELEGAGLLFADSPPQNYKCTFQDIDPTDGTITEIETEVYTMPLIPNNGPTISDRNKSDNFADPALQDLPLFQRLKLFDNLAEQIQHLHQHNAIMPDLKPSNVLVCGSKASPYMRLIDGGGVAKLADIAKSARKRQEEEAPSVAVSDIPIESLGPKGAKLRAEPPINYAKKDVKRKAWEKWFQKWKEENDFPPQTSFSEVVTHYRSLDQPQAQESNLELPSDGVIKGVMAAEDFEVSPITITPEICLDDYLKHSISKQSDIYNLGRILFTVLGGDIDETYLETAIIKKTKPFAEMTQITKNLFKEKFGSELSSCQKELQDLLISCFNDDPKERPNITELRAALKNLEQLSLTPSEQVDKLLTQLANQGATREIIDALNTPMQLRIIPYLFTNFLKLFIT